MTTKPPKKSRLKWGLKTLKQVRFVEEYIIDNNATQAAIRAGYSENSASITATRLLAKANVSDIVDKQLEKQAARIQVSAERVLEEYATIAFAKLDQFMEWRDGKIQLKDSKELPPEIIGAIQSIKETVTPNGTVSTEIKLYNKVRALDSLAKHFNLFKGEDDTKEVFSAIIQEFLAYVRSRQIVRRTSLPPAE